jgi:hypothetical protein
MSVFNVEYGVLFIHVPKTAGTSMEKCYFLGGGGHKPVTHYRGAKADFSFSFVRNPWDRFVSAYFSHDHIVGFPFSKEGFHNYIKFNIVNHPGEYPCEHVYTTHFRPQHFFLLDEEDQIGVDFVGRFESLMDDWLYVCEQIDVDPTIEHLRKGDHKPYEYYYTPETWDYVGELYRRDIELFGYDSA